VQVIAALLIAPTVAILWHEAAHAAFALAVTRGPVVLQVGFGPAAIVRAGRLTLRLGPILLGGYCAYQGWLRRGDRALVAAAGPISSAFLAALAWNLRHTAPPPLIARCLGDIAVVSAGMALITAIPMRYPGGLARGGGSDGLTVLKAVFPATRVALAGPRIERRPRRPLRAPFAAVLGAATVLAFMANVWLGVWLLVLFGFAYAGERA
jgi:hypothetical protein